jgi:hypothetical protein
MFVQCAILLQLRKRVTDEEKPDEISAEEKSVQIVSQEKKKIAVEETADERC